MQPTSSRVCLWFDYYDWFIRKPEILYYLVDLTRQTGRTLLFQIQHGGPDKLEVFRIV